MKPFFDFCYLFILKFTRFLRVRFAMILCSQKILDLLGQDRKSHYVLRPKSSATSSVKKLEKKKLPGAARKCRIHSGVDFIVN